MPHWFVRIIRRWRLLWLFMALALYLALAMHQLGLPGLHYDEAAEAGVNALELLTGAPVTAFRGATVTLFGRRLPLMVQDYIGSLNVYLALPFLGLTGIGVPNLRLLSVLTGLAALLLLERAISEFGAPLLDERWTGSENPKSKTQDHKSTTPISLAGLIAVSLLAVSPSFVFWSRQGIFVTNLTQPLCCWCIWQGLRWLRTGRLRSLSASAFAGGLALYAKLLAVWIVGPFALLLAAWWFWWRTRQDTPGLTLRGAAVVIGAFVLPLVPCALFNWQTGGTLQRVLESLDQSYYGVNNQALWVNAGVRAEQLWQTLSGNHFWYLGGLYGNALAPWLALCAAGGGLLQHPQRVAPPLLLLVLAYFCSLFTVSDLFITHYALLQPLAGAVVGIALVCGLSHPVDDDVRGQVVEPRGAAPPSGLGAGLPRYALVVLLTVWLSLDLLAVMRYHQGLAQSGGLLDHSDASYHLAYHLEHHGMGAPIALDWGFAAPVRYLSRGTVTPLEIFGYASPQMPDAKFGERLRAFLVNSDNVYLLHAPGATVFAGRREVLFAEGAALGLRLVLEREFYQRDGAPLYEIWRATPL